MTKFELKNNVRGRGVMGIQEQEVMRAPKHTGAADTRAETEGPAKMIPWAVIQPSPKRAEEAREVTEV